MNFPINKESSLYKYVSIDHKPHHCKNELVNVRMASVVTPVAQYGDLTTFVVTIAYSEVR